MNYQTEMEMRLLGQLIRYPELIGKVNLPTEYFTPTNQLIYEKILELSSENLKIDILILAARLPEVNPGIISELHDCMTDANFEYYQNYIRENRYKTRLSLLSENIPKWNATENIETVLQKIQDEIDDLSDSGKPYRITKIKDGLGPAIDEIEKRYQSRDSQSGLRTGIEKLDEILSADPKQRLYYIGGRPGEGKTALMLNIITHQARTENKKIGVINLESSTKEMLLRMLSETGNIDGVKLSTGLLQQNDMSRLIDGAQILRDLNIYFYDEPNISLQRLISKMRYMVRTKGVEIIFIDYLQLLYYKKDGMKRHEEIAYISRMLKDQARRLNIPIVVLAQLTRDADGRRPRLGDFSESSQIEKDADVAILIYHRLKWAVNNITGVYQITIDEWWLCVEKNRDGRIKTIPVDFEKKYVRFVSRRVTE